MGGWARGDRGGEGVNGGKGREGGKGGRGGMVVASEKERGREEGGGGDI